MGYVIRMPQLGMSMERGTVVEWAVGEGEAVAEGETIVVVESEKTQSEVEAREDGRLGRILVDEGETVEPGDPIGILVGPEEEVATYEEGLEVPAPAAGGGGGGSAPSGATGSEAGASSESTTGTAADVRATPGARRLAEERGVDLAGIEGSGPQGVITDEDVEAHAGAAGTDAGSSGGVRATPGARALAEERGVDLGTVDGTGPQGVITEADVEDRAGTSAGGATRTVIESAPLSGMQQTISERLGESYREAVHVTLNRAFDTGPIDAAVAAGREAGVDVSLPDLLICAAAEALSAHPDVNAVYEDGEHQRIAEVNVGVAIDVERGLVTPVIPDVGEKSAADVNAIRRELTDRVTRGEFTMDDLSGGTFTISNLGLFGVDDFDPIINPPEVAILGVGRTRDDGSMTLSLSFDHRVVNGADAARFLDTLVTAATDPATLAGFFDADVSIGAAEPGRASETRDVGVTSPAGYAGAYRVAGREVAFDEPTDAGGTGQAPTPVEHLLGALGSCLSLAFRAMADRDGIAVGEIGCDVDGHPEHGVLEGADVVLSIESDASDEALDTAVTKAERACYVERALSDDLEISVSWDRRG